MCIIYIMYVSYVKCLHVIPNAHLNDSAISLTGINKIVLYCIVLYCIVLYCIVLYCIVLLLLGLLFQSPTPM